MVVISQVAKGALCWSALHHCNKIPESTCKEGSFTVAHGFKDFGPWWLSLIASRPGPRQHFLTGNAWPGTLLV